MELSVEGNSDTLTVHVTGELVADTCGDLREMVMEAIARNPRKIQVDLKGTSFIDTSGLGVLVGLLVHLKPKGIALQVKHPSPKVLQVLRMTRMMALFGLQEEN